MREKERKGRERHIERKDSYSFKKREREKERYQEIMAHII
jgi:hypothetical protein